MHNHSFDRLVEICDQEENFFLAVSNPCFEIWFLLHFIDPLTLTKNEIDKLLENKRITHRKNYIDKKVGEAQGKPYNSRRPNTSLYFSLTNEAIKRAKALDEKGERYPRYIGTHVYKLVEKLIK